MKTKSGNARKKSKKKIVQVNIPDQSDFSVYNPDFHPLDFIGFCKEGKHRSQICMAWGIHRATLDGWVGKHKEFGEAYLKGRECFEAFWYDLGLNMVLGKLRGNDKVYQFLAKNTIGWGDEALTHPWNLVDQDDAEFIID